MRTSLRRRIRKVQLATLLHSVSSCSADPFGRWNGFLQILSQNGAERVFCVPGTFETIQFSRSRQQSSHTSTTYANETRPIIVTYPNGNAGWKLIGHAQTSKQLIIFRIRLYRPLDVVWKTLEQSCMVLLGAEVKFWKFIAHPLMRRGRFFTWIGYPWVVKWHPDKAPSLLPR